MIHASICRRITRAASRFVRAKDGNIAVTFALASVPLFCFVGAAIDYSRAATARTAMQAVLDSTVLMVAKDLTSGAVQPANVNTAANNYFQGLFASYTAANHRDAYVDSLTATYTASNGSTPATISATASGHIATVFMRAAGLLVPGGSGFQTMGFNTSSTSTWGNVKMRVALVLDNTGSMSQNNKIGALKTAVAGTGGLIDQLSALSHNPGDVYISIIPFAKVVNVGAQVNGSNIDWTDWQNDPFHQPNNGSFEATIPNSRFATQAAWNAYFAAIGPSTPCPFTSANGFPNFVCASSSTTAASHVTTIPASGNICPSLDNGSHTFYNGCWNSVANTGSTQVPFCTGSSCTCTGFPGSSNCSCTGSGSSKTCAVIKSSTYSHTWQPNATSTWSGCVTDRTQPSDTSGDVTTQFPANQYGEGSGKGYCDSSSNPQLEPIIPLSQSWTALKSAINAMQPTGGTDQAIGLAWGWQSLIVGGVLNAPAEDANTTYNRVIILLSDGLNTEDRWPDYGNGSTQNNGSNDPQFPGLIDARQRILCDNLKNARDAQNRAMYTIYTIQANTATPADPTSAILQYCASSPDKFYELTNSNEIITTFQSIGTALSKLRVAM
jgi:Flp pilus assembly protein TadG